jgi:hypothetical protein
MKRFSAKGLFLFFLSVQASAQTIDVITTSEIPELSSMHFSTCTFLWDVNSRSFSRLIEDLDDVKLSLLSVTYIPLAGKENYVSALRVQLLEADLAGQNDLVKQLALEYRDSSISILFPKILTSEFVTLVAEERELKSNCR